jgi:phosphoribosyl-dephospho-CoA transferase
MVWSAHDLLQISGCIDLVKIGQEPSPVWIERSLRLAPFVVVRRANPFDGLIPVGVRGSIRNQRFGAYLGAESVLRRIAPEQLNESYSLQNGTRTKRIPALNALVEIKKNLSHFPLTYGPTGSVGFELASGLLATTAASDLDLLIRTPERLSMKLAQELMKIFSRIPCRVDAQLETPRGAVSLIEYTSGQLPLLLRKSGGPVLVDDPWRPLI